MKTMTKLEIIEHSFGENGVYSTDPWKRGMDAGACVYRGYLEDDNGQEVEVNCALGQWVLPRYLDMDLDNCDPSGSSASEVLEIMVSTGVVSDLDEMLMPQVRGHSVEFWEAMQTMHDNAQNFDYEGKCLTLQGEANLRNLRRYEDTPREHIRISEHFGTTQTT